MRFGKTGPSMILLGRDSIKLLCVRHRGNGDGEDRPVADRVCHSLPVKRVQSLRALDGVTSVRLGSKREPELIDAGDWIDKRDRRRSAVVDGDLNRGRNCRRAAIIGCDRGKGVGTCGHGIPGQGVRRAGRLTQSIRSTKEFDPDDLAVSVGSVRGKGDIGRRDEG